jgi:chemotaxis protein methyltransferase CheR
LHHFDSIELLTEKLLADSTFFDLFIKEITVNTTEMFRDASCWKVIREEIIPLVRELPTIRIWHAGCSSGEEVFSMAILLKEEGLLEKSKIIASDLNKDIIECAKKGCYSLKTLELNADNYIQSGGKKNFSDYYSRQENCYLMNSSLLTNVGFMKHDLSSGKEFSKFDIILCRNVMIYFNKNLQENVFSLFQKSLFKRGFIIIGKKESMTYYTNSRMFTETNSIEKIYRLNERSH